MNPWRWVDPRVRAVRVADLQAYFMRKGWRLAPNPNPNLLRFEELSDKGKRPLFQMIPASERFADYGQRIAELITTLSEIEERHPVEVLNDILQQGSAAPPDGPPSEGVSIERPTVGR